MAGTSALSIIDEFTYSNNTWKKASTESSKRGSDDSKWLILKTNTTEGSPDYIDIDRYYNFYGVMSPRVEVEFRVGKPEDGGLEWVNICGEPYALLTNKETKVTEERKLAVARIKKNDKYHIGYVFYDSTDLKTDGTCDVPDSEISIGKTIGENREVTSIYQKNVNNNYFVSANIEDSGFRNLTLELYDRSFTTIQSLLFEAISNASSTAIEGEGEVSNSNSSYNLAFIKMPSLTNNNIRVRYGYNEDTSTTVPSIEYWSKMGLDNDYYKNFYKPENKSRPYRWVSRKNQSTNITVGINGDGEEYATTSDVATDNILYNTNNQSTVMGGYEEFYITNVQSNLTNTGIRYQISAVGNDALKLNGYKMVQKYAEIVAKPEEILAAFMKMFNYESGGPTNSDTSMIKLIWTDERSFVGIKKIVLNKKGEYEAQSTDDQRKEIEKNKELASFLNKRISVLSSALGLLETQVVSDNEWVVAGNVTEAKKYYSNYNPGSMFIKDGKEPDMIFGKGKVLDNINKTNQKGLFLYEISTSIPSMNDDKLKNAKYMGILNHYLNKYNYNFAEPNTSDREYKDDNETLVGSQFYNYRIGNAASAYLLGLKYDYDNIDYSEINKHFKVKETQLKKIDLIKELKDLLEEYVSSYGVTYTSGNAKGVYVRLPIFIEHMLREWQARMMSWVVWHNGATVDGKTVTGALPTSEFAKAWKNRKDSTYASHKLLPESTKFEQDQDERAGVSYSGWSNPQGAFLGAFGALGGYISASDIDKKIEKLEKSQSIPNPFENTSDLNGQSATVQLIAILYALGCSVLYDSYGNLNTRDSARIQLNSIKRAHSGYKIYNFDFAYKNGYRYVAGNLYVWDKDGVQSNNDSSKVPDEWKTRQFTWGQALETGMGATSAVIEQYFNKFCDIVIDICSVLKEELDSAAAPGNENWSKFTTIGQLDKVCSLIDSDTFKLNDIVKEKCYKITDRSGTQEYIVNNYGSYIADNKISLDAYTKSDGRTIGSSINDIYEKVFALKKQTDKNSNLLNTETVNNNYKELAKEISKEIESLNKKLKETTDLVSKQESNILNDEITISLGGESASHSGSKKYKSISSLLNEFCAACPPYIDYEATTRLKNQVLRGEAEDADKKKYIDENGNEQELSIKENLPSYTLTWDIVGYYKDKYGVYMPVVGLHYKKPIKPKKLRVYKWGTGNPDAHAIKSLNISSSSEFAMLSSAANSTLTIDGYKKAAVKGIDEANEEATKASYENYNPGDSPSYFKNIVTNNDRHKIVDAMFNSINRGTITLLGDPSLRFGGRVNPYCFPIYLDIKLQNEGKATVPSVASNGMPSTLSGVYVVSKITHSLTQQGYTTTLEVMRYPGINEVIES